MENTEPNYLNLVYYYLSLKRYWAKYYMFFFVFWTSAKFLNDGTSEIAAGNPIRFRFPISSESEQNTIWFLLP